ncbi:MAG: co-chaperone GroES [Armatimonadota bacterium]|nr:co-chaperone GroES [Armatimonadota bacterium]MCX7777350.1 co-chaperone GroES [Armatimonadota bacterium]MDW8025382.1 co-chaperone GroES [Armatimonadota bacterium]
MKVRLLGDRVLIKPLEQDEKSPGGIILPDTVKEKPQEGIVVAVGEGRLLANGEYHPMRVKINDTVIFSRYAGIEIRIDGKDYIIVNEESVLAVKEGE